MDNQKPTYDYLYTNYEWPEPGTERQCPFSGLPLHLNPKREGYNGKPWDCPKCLWFFSEEELKNWSKSGYKDCPYTLSQKTQLDEDRS